MSNIRSFVDSERLELGNVTLLVGRNNTGKSTILRAVGTLQAEAGVDVSAIRVGRSEGVIDVELSDVDPDAWNGRMPRNGDASVQITIPRNQAITWIAASGGRHNVSQIANREPVAFIYPYYSGRKVRHYEPTIDDVRAHTVTDNLASIAARVDVLNSPRHPRHALFLALVDEVIGIPIDTHPSQGGKQPGRWVNSTEWINLRDMGEGVAQMLGLIVNLCLATGKLFLIEELENDIHPEALKSLLRVIERSAATNQFIVSTHNNIVLRYLGALPETVIYELTSEIVDDGGNSLELSKAVRVGNSVEERIHLLAHLGYELSDLDLHDGWLIFEESSAERIVREYLIPWFAPRLRRVKTVSSRGTGDLSKTFEALNKLVLFSHLEARYRGRVRVLADGEESGLKAVEQLRALYPSWGPEAFQNLDETDFELYFPENFRDEAAAVLSRPDRRAKREGKTQLLMDLIDWIDEDEQRARSAFEESAADVIERLRDFESTF